MNSAPTGSNLPADQMTAHSGIAVGAPTAEEQLPDAIVEVRKWLPNAPDDEWVKKHCPIELSFAERMNAALRENREKDARIAELEQRLAIWEPRESAEVGGSI